MFNPKNAFQAAAIFLAGIGVGLLHIPSVVPAQLAGSKHLAGPQLTSQCTMAGDSIHNIRHSQVRDGGVIDSAMAWAIHYIELPCIVQNNNPQ